MTLNKFFCAILAAAIFVSSCATPTIKINEMPVLPGAVQGNKFPEFGTQMHFSITAANDLITAKIGKFDQKLFTLSQPVVWQELARFYDGELGKKALTRSGEPVDSGEDKILFYTQESSFTKKGAAVLLIETVNHNNQDKYYFLLLCVSQS